MFHVAAAGMKGRLKATHTPRSGAGKVVRHLLLHHPAKISFIYYEGIEKQRRVSIMIDEQSSLSIHHQSHLRMRVRVPQYMDTFSLRSWA
jgi:hypothetical protein